MTRRRPAQSPSSNAARPDRASEVRRWAECLPRCLEDNSRDRGGAVGCERSSPVSITTNSNGLSHTLRSTEPTSPAPDPWGAWRTAVDQGSAGMRGGDEGIAIKKFRTAVTLARRISPEDPRVGISLERLGWAQFESRQLAQAKATLVGALKFFEGSSTAGSREHMRVLWYLGDAHRELGQFDEADLWLRCAHEMQTLALQPDDPDRLDVLFSHAKVMLHRGDHHGALKNLDAVIALAAATRPGLARVAQMNRDLVQISMKDDSGVLPDLPPLQPMPWLSDDRCHEIQSMSVDQLTATAVSENPAEAHEAACALYRQGPRVTAKILSRVRGFLGSTRGGTNPIEETGVSSIHDHWALPRKRVAKLVDLLVEFGPKAVNQVRALAQDPSEAVRVAIVSCLGEMATRLPEVEVDLIKALEDASPRVRAMAASQFGAVKEPSPDVVAALRRLATDAAPDEAWVYGALALLAVGRELDLALPLAATLLRHPLVAVRINCLTAAEVAGVAARPLVEAISERLMEDEPMCRKLALKALWKVAERNTDLVRRVSPLTRDGQSEVRAIASSILEGLERKTRAA